VDPRPETRQEPPPSGARAERSELHAAAAGEPAKAGRQPHEQDRDQPWDTAGARGARSEPDLRPLDPRVKPRWWVGGTVTLLQVLIPITLLDFVIPHPLPSGRISLGVLAVGALLVAVLPLVRYRRWRYALREEDLWIRFGLLTVTVSVIPYRRLQFVDTRSGPIDRLFGLSELIVHTAALGTSGRLPGLDASEAERLREVLSHIAPDDAL
jgi:uncharacterized protein